jgi:penicillin-binding protein 2
VLKRKWWAGETISVAIGQGAVAVTPLQLAYAIGGIVSGGFFRRPHLAFRDQLLALGGKPLEEDRRFPLTDATVETVSRGMWGVVNEGGTGTSAHSPGLEIAGKTGTAQVVSASLKDSGGKAEFKNNAWFVGYAPLHNPEIVVCALVLQGEHSAVAAPVVRDVIKTYYDKKATRLAPRPVEQTAAKVLSQVIELRQLVPRRGERQ